MPGLQRNRRRDDIRECAFLFTFLFMLVCQKVTQQHVECVSNGSLLLL